MTSIKVLLAVLALVQLSWVVVRANDKWESSSNQLSYCQNDLNAWDKDEQIKRLFDGKKCALLDSQCITVFANDFPNLQVFEMEAVEPSVNTYIYEMYCFERVGVYTFGSDVSSFVAFLSDQDSSNGIAEERDTIKFYKDIDAIEDDFPKFADYYKNFSGTIAANVGLIASMAMALIFKHLF
ncbi:uncharacterized protein LOC142349355 [Convolutriloba macropyga]|uniref:uncharacterized protein LOC142349355 n=1 Tax=Convolutriloba macropyga TaxID=536237 RepID=UPI003F524384